MDRAHARRMLKWLQMTDDILQTQIVDAASRARNDLSHALKTLRLTKLTGKDLAKALDHTISAAKILSKLVSESKN